MSAPRRSRDRALDGTWRDVVAVAIGAAVLRVVGAGIVYALGFRAVSDDDFARVVIAQRFAAAPALDPTGTSWLPLPFWITGSAMKVFGGTLFVARAVAVSHAALAGALVAAVAVCAGMRPMRAFAAAAVAAAMPWGMQLAVATVPEVPAAACAAAAMIAVASRSSRLRLVGALALLASTWSRYDAWPVAIAFAGLCLWDARSPEHATPRERLQLLVAAALAVLGPSSWALWQYTHYGDAFRYLRLVRSYRQALGGVGPSLAERLVGYPYGVVEEMREVFGAGVVGAVCAWLVRRRDVPIGAREGLGLDVRRPLLLALLQLLVLIAGDVRDGAPTHHPERALLAPATVVIFMSADAFFGFLAGVRTAAMRAVAAVCAVSILVGWIGLRLHRSLRWFAAAPRVRELASGYALAAHVPRDARALIDTRDMPGGGIDYGYYAVLAAFGRPLASEIDRDQDPRKPRVPSSFDDTERLATRLRGANARAVLVWGEARRRTVEALGGAVFAAESPPGAEPAVGLAEGRTWYVLVLPRVP